MKEKQILKIYNFNDSLRTSQIHISKKNKESPKQAVIKHHRESIKQYAIYTFTLEMSKWIRKPSTKVHSDSYFNKLVISTAANDFLTEEANRASIELPHHFRDGQLNTRASQIGTIQ